MTDGYRFTQTDRAGRYRLDTDTRAGFVYIATPAGHIPAFDGGAPVFYHALEPATKTYDFTLAPFGNATDYTLFAVTDPQTENDAQFARFERETVADMLSHASAQTGAVMAVQLGDIVWDNLPLMERNKQTMAALGFPVWPVAGNHDYDESQTGDDAAAGAYRRNFGPEYYAFNSGADHYIVLDGTIYDTKRQYTEGFDKRQIDWLRGYLKYIPSGAHLVICSHDPFMPVDSPQPSMIEGAEEILELVQNYRVDILSGHTHVGSRTQIRPWALEHNLGAACGAWWTASLNKCGTPNGYGVYRGAAYGAFTWYYKSTGRPADYQLEVYPLGTVPGHSQCIVAKAWGWDEKWTVTYSEDGAPHRPMTQIRAYDPDYLDFLSHRRARGRHEVGNYKQPVMRSFYFAAEPSRKARAIEITATDRFGNKFTKIFTL